MSTDSDVRRVAFASSIGTTLEWYDFFIFAAAAALVFNKLFFPSVDPVAGTIAALASSTVGFISRPLGGIVFGHFGDRFGRKRMMVASLTGMGVVTFLIGLLPTYSSIGIAAPVLLVSLRFLQGIAIGGEWGAASVLVVEHSTPKNRGFYGSWPQMGVPAALLLSSGVMALVNGMTSADEFAAWGWRVPFLLSGLLVIVGIVVRMKVSESPSFQRLQAARTRVQVPLLALLRKEKKRTLLMAGSIAGENISFYLIAVYSLVFLTQNVKVPRPVALQALMIAAACMLVTGPLFGALSDRIGRKKVKIFGIVFLGLFMGPFFAMLSTGSYPLIVLAMTLAMAVGQGAAQGSLPSLFAEQYPAEIRVSGVSLAFQLATIVWSGPTPVVAALLVIWAGSWWPLPALVGGAAVMAVLCNLQLREAAGQELEAFPSNPAEQIVVGRTVGATA
jgi:MHS family shikimate/dehydroshikimate transporter-like MFS transporter